MSQVLLMLYAAQTRAEETANCNDDVSLLCPGTNTTSFVSVTWYKVCFRLMLCFHSVHTVVSDARISVLCQRSTRTEKRG